MSLHNFLKFTAVGLIVAMVPFVWPWLSTYGVSPLIGNLVGFLMFGLVLLIIKKL